MLCSSPNLKFTQRCVSRGTDNWYLHRWKYYTVMSIDRGSTVTCRYICESLTNTGRPGARHGKDVFCDAVYVSTHLLREVRAWGGPGSGWTGLRASGAWWCLLIWVLAKPVCLGLCLSTDTHALRAFCLHILHPPKSIKKYQEKTCLSQKNLDIEVPFLALPFNVSPNHNSQKLNCLRFIC